VDRKGFGTLGLAAAVVLSVVASACGGDSTMSGTTPPPATSGGTGGGGNIGATEKDFSITLDNSQASTGAITFSIQNVGPSVHEFVVFQTDLAPDKLPVDSGAVDEEGTGVTHVDEVEDIAVGATESLTLTLEAGNYVVICNIPGHYLAGMHAALTVG